MNGNHEDAGTPRRVVVAHQDRALRTQIAEWLREDGHAVSDVRDGAKALELGLRPTCDLVLAAHDLPRVGGAELAAELRAMPHGGPALILLIPRDSEIDRAALVDLGVDDCLASPPRREDLDFRVRVALRTGASRRRARAAAARAVRDRERMESVIGAMLDGFLVIEPSGTVTFANDRLAVLTGFPREEIVGTRPPYAFWPAEEMQNIRDALVRRLPDGEGEFDVAFRHRDGHHVPVIVSVSQRAGSDGEPGPFVLTVKDVSDRKRQEAEIARLTRLYQGILESAGEGIFGVDRKGWVTFANPAASAMLGWSVDEILGQSMHVFGSHTRADGTPFPVEEWFLSAAIDEGEVRRVDDEEFWRADGTSFPVEYTSTPVVENGEIVGAVCCFTDITERRRAEEEIRRERDLAASLAEELEQQNTQLQQQQETLGRLLRELSSEKGRVEIVYEFSLRLAAETDLDAVAHEALRGFVNTTGAARGALYATAGEGPEAPMALAARRGLGDEGAPELVGVLDGHVARALATGTPVVREAGDRPLLARGSADAPPELAVPLVHGGRPLGVVLLAWASGAVPNPADLETVEHLGAPTSVALAHARSFEAALRQAGITRAVLDATPDGIRLVDLEGKVVLQNPSFERIYHGMVGPPGRTLLERASAFASRVKDPEAYLARMEQIDGDPGLEATDEYELAGSERVLVRYTGPVRNAAGAVIGRIFVHRDVTAERQAERMKDEFVALASHELRSPLTSVLGYMELVLDGEAGELRAEQEEFLRTAERNARRLMRLVDDLILAAQAGAGQLTVVPGQTDLATIAADSVEAFRSLADDRGLDLVLRADSAPLAADAGRIRQVVDNLVGNAIKFTGAGGRVTVTVRADGGEACVDVADTGMGIPAEELDGLFARFYRTARANRDQIPGTGLGLAISRGLVEAHGGRIDVESVEGAGTTFYVRLPQGVLAARAA